MPKPIAMSLNDDPIKTREEDLLGHYDIAKELADWVIDDQGYATSEVYGLVGGWGTGKSGVLNLLEQEIKDRYAGAIVVRFNPWLITGREGMGKSETLIKDFLLTLYETLDKARGGRGQRDKVLNALADYAIALSPSFRVAFGNQYDLSSIADRLNSLLRPQHSLNDLKTKLETALKTTSRPIIVLIDELDRIDDDEIMAMLQMVKAVMQIKGISFVVAYNNIIVENIIKSTSKLNFGESSDLPKNYGQIYLQKIVKKIKPILNNRFFNFAIESNNASKLYNIYTEYANMGIFTPRLLKKVQFELDKNKTGTPIGTFEKIISLILDNIPSAKDYEDIKNKLKDLEIKEGIKFSFIEKISNMYILNIDFEDILEHQKFEYVSFLTAYDSNLKRNSPEKIEHILEEGDVPIEFFRKFIPMIVKDSEEDNKLEIIIRKSFNYSHNKHLDNAFLRNHFDDEKIIILSDLIINGALKEKSESIKETIFNIITLPELICRIIYKQEGLDLSKKPTIEIASDISKINLFKEKFMDKFTQTDIIKKLKEINR